jgi:hypothetical protein
LARPSGRATFLRRPAFAWLVVLALPVFAYATLFAPLPFFRTLWDAQVADALHVRQRMADRLVDARGLQGKSRAQVVALLGEPDEPADSVGDMVYVLGDERSFLGIDSELLAIRFDASGQVVAAKIRTD